MCGHEDSESVSFLPTKFPLDSRNVSGIQTNCHRKKIVGKLKKNPLMHFTSERLLVNGAYHFMI